jgi:predicted DNA-binding transcriptional regulator YafY
MPDQPATLRHWLLLRSLAARRQGATLRELAADHRVDQKTFHRDLLLLRRLGFQLKFESGYRGLKHWKLDGSAGLAQLSFTLEEAAALYLAGNSSSPWPAPIFFRAAPAPRQRRKPPPKPR